MSNVRSIFVQKCKSLFHIWLVFIKSRNQLTYSNCEPENSCVMCLLHTLRLSKVELHAKGRGIKAQYMRDLFSMFLHVHVLGLMYLLSMMLGPCDMCWKWFVHVVHWCSPLMFLMLLSFCWLTTFNTKVSQTVSLNFMHFFRSKNQLIAIFKSLDS